MRLAALLLAGAVGGLATEPGFESLFDGRTIEGWTLLPRESGRGAWRVVDSMLTVDGRPGNLASEGEFGDFELRLEWKVGPGGNGGVFYRVTEDGGAWGDAIEYQLADNARQASQANPDRRAGAAYGLYPPREGLAKPAGQWNTLRIVARGKRVEHWLNGRKAVEFEVDSEDFRRRASARFPDRPTFAKARSGRIVLQDHGSTVWFRNLRIRVFGAS